MYRSRISGDKFGGRVVDEKDYEVNRRYSARR